MGKKVVSELMHTFFPPNKIYFPRNIKIQFVFQEPFVALIALSFFHRFLLKFFFAQIVENVKRKFRLVLHFNFDRQIKILGMLSPCERNE